MDKALQLTTSKVLFTQEEERALFEEFQSSSTSEIRKKVLLNKIVLNFTPLVHRIQRQFSGYRMDSDDLIGEGMLALTEAAHRFEIEHGNRFAAYAISWIRGVMMAFITKNYAMVNYCTDATKKALFFHLRKVISAEQKKLDTFELSPDLLEAVSFKLGVPIKEIRSILAMFESRYDGLDDMVGDGLTRLDTIEAVQDNHHETDDQTRYQKEIIRAGMDRMNFSQRERVVIEAQYLGENGTKKTLEEVGKVLNISKERVRQIRNKAYTRLVEGIRRTVKDKGIPLHEVF